MDDWEIFPFKEVGVDDLDLDGFVGVVNLESVVAGAADEDNLNVEKYF